MDGTTWTREEVRELKKLRLDPIRNTPARLRLLVAHFLKPEASVFAVTEGDGPVRVSKAQEGAGPDAGRIAWLGSRGWTSERGG
jgi:hypothetical protein